MLFKRWIPGLLFIAILCPTLATAESAPYRTGQGERNATEEAVFYFDEHTPDFSNLSFGIDESERLKPMANDFELVHVAPMSNRLGERAALVTVRNTAGGRRFLKNQYIAATFADATQAYPGEINESVDPGETFTTTLYFGVHRYPIVKIEMQP